MTCKSVVAAKRAIVLVLDWASRRPQAHKLLAESGALLKYSKENWAWIKYNTELIKQDFDYLASSFGLDTTGAEIELELMRCVSLSVKSTLTKRMTGLRLIVKLLCNDTRISSRSRDGTFEDAACLSGLS